MSDISIQFSNDFNGFHVESPEKFEGRLKFSIPEFHGKQGEAKLAIRKNFEASDNGNGGLQFQMDVNPVQAGIGFGGHIQVVSATQINFEVEMVNRRSESFENAHSTFLLDVSEAPIFEDPDAQRTMMYTETGWESLEHLSNEPGVTVNRRHRPFNIGAAYNKTTIMWRMLSRFSQDKSMLLAMAISQGYAFASDHELYKHCLVAGNRWGTLSPDAPQTTYGRIYLLEGSLEMLHATYNKDFRGNE